MITAFPPSMENNTAKIAKDAKDAKDAQDFELGQIGDLALREGSDGCICYFARLCRPTGFSPIADSSTSPARNGTTHARKEL